jgi:hypothetical protein
MRGSIKKKDVALYTSLPPRMGRQLAGEEIGAHYQNACIASWLQLGFDVVSLNSRAEIDILSRSIPNGVTFSEVSTGRPRIVEFLNAIRDSKKPVAGIINADCLLVANDGIIRPLLHAAKTGLVLSERTNIRADDARATGVSCSGFDFMCFATEALDRLEIDQEITIGTPWWDYWFPVAYQRAGGKLFILPGQPLIHLDHEVGWSTDNWRLYGRKMYAAMVAASGTEPTDLEIISFAWETFYGIRKSASPIGIDDVTARILLNFISAADRTSAERDAKAIELSEVLSYHDYFVGKPIDFSSTKTPYSLEELRGVSWPEPWGRWTDDDVTTLAFRAPLPEHFFLEIFGRPSSSMLGKVIKAEVNGRFTKFRMSDDKPRSYRVPIANKGRSNTIRLHFSNAKSPAILWGNPNLDGRKLGIAISMLRIVEKTDFINTLPLFRRARLPADAFPLNDLDKLLTKMRKERATRRQLEGDSRRQGCKQRRRYKPPPLAIIRADEDARTVRETCFLSVKSINPPVA